MDYVSLLAKAKSDVEDLVDKFPIPREVRQSDTYESTAHFLLAYCILRRLGGEYTRVRFEQKIGDAWVDIDVGTRFGLSRLLIEVKPNWDWKGDRKAMVQDIRSDSQKLSELRDNSKIWKGERPVKCAVVMALFDRPSVDPSKSKEFRELRTECRNKSVELFFLRMYPKQER